MKTLTKGALKIIGDVITIQDAFANARSLADAHDDHGPLNLQDDPAEARLVAILRYSPDLISKGLATLPAEYRPQIEELLATAVNLGKAMEAMDIHSEHGPKIDGKLRSDGALAGINEKTKYAESEIESVRNLYDSLKGKFTQDAPLRREIAGCIKDPKMTERVVRNIIDRYILNKPRSKGRGRRK